MNWSSLLSKRRLGSHTGDDDAARSPFERDYDRIIFSPAFRRLHDKTQVFPMPENDQIHSRLTHTIETASVGYSLGKACGAEIVQRYRLDAHPGDFGDIVASACLAHDIGNPPFGHSGESAISAWFRAPENEHLLRGLDDDERSDLRSFEGNAQGFRVLTRLHIYPENGGMRLSCATLGTGMKYPVSSLHSATARSRNRKRIHERKYGFFKTERQIFRAVAAEICLHQDAADAWRRHPLAYLTEAADDICYRVLDAEDGFALRYVSFDELCDHLLPIIRFTETAYMIQDTHDPECVGHLRARAIHSLVQQVQDAFISHESAILAGDFAHALIEMIPAARELERLRAFVASRCYLAPPVIEAELAGYEVLGRLLSMFVPAAIASMPNDRQQKLCSYLTLDAHRDQGLFAKILRVTDCLTAMTDSFALRLYQRLTGISVPRR